MEPGGSKACRGFAGPSMRGMATGRDASTERDDASDKARPTAPVTIASG